MQEKEAVVGALNAEIDHLRAETSSPNSSQSRGSSIQGRDIISLYHIKVCCISLSINIFFFYVKLWNVHLGNRCYNFNVPFLK